MKYNLLMELKGYGIEPDLSCVINGNPNILMGKYGQDPYIDAQASIVYGDLSDSVKRNIEKEKGAKL